jgi:thioredoxin-like negative regulator of GroEL
MSPLLPKINTTEAEDISVEMGVDALPTIQFYRGKKMIGEFKGSDIAVVDKVVRSHVQKASA